MGEQALAVNMDFSDSWEANVEPIRPEGAESLDFVGFYATSLKLAMGASFTRADHEAVMDYLRRRNEIGEMRSRAEFVAALHQVARTLAAAGFGESLDELFELYEGDLLTSSTLVEALLRHYGQRVVGDAGQSAAEGALQAFEALELVAGAPCTRGLARIYRILIEAKRARGTVRAEVVNLIDRCSLLGAGPLTSGVNEMLLRSRWENWASWPTAQSQEIERVVRDLLGTYGDVIAERFDVDRDTLQLVADQGVDEDEADLLALLLAEGAMAPGQASRQLEMRFCR